jgi:hypothetical protein
MQATSVYRHVRFVPWVGGGYQSGGVYGRRLPVVGESHYTDWADSDGATRRHLLDPGFTAATVMDFASNGGGAPTWSLVEKIVAADTVPDFWHQVAFYNYVQFPLEGTPRDRRPSEDEWAGSELGFKEVVEELKPERIYIFGSDTWSRARKGMTVVPGESPKYPDGHCSLADGQNCYAVFSRHPGSPFHRPAALARADYVRRFIAEDRAG